MRNRTQHIVLVVFVVVLAACQTVVEIEVPDTPSKLTVNSLFGTDSAFIVSVTASKGILEDGTVSEVTNATVTITGSDGSSETVIGANYEGFSDWKPESMQYRFALAAKPGMDYTITASAKGFETVSAKTHVPTPVQIVRVDTGSKYVDEWTQRQGQISVTLDDPAGVENFYELHLYMLTYYPDTFGGILNWWPMYYEIYAYEEQDEGVQIDLGGSYEVGMRFSDELFNGQHYTTRLNYWNEATYDDSTTLEFYLSYYLVTELRSLSSDYYKFHTSYNTYLMSVGDPFSQPTQVYGNVDKGFGIFAGFSNSRDTTLVKKGSLPSPLD